PHFPSPLSPASLSCRLRVPPPLPSDTYTLSLHDALPIFIKPGTVMTVPEAENSATRGVSSADVPTILTVAVYPVASTICEATVRFQISSYNRNSSAVNEFLTCDGVRK